MQSLAVLLDSIRELRSRYLFWISLSISVLAALALFGMIGFNEQGWRILWFETQPSEYLRSGSPGARDTMSWMFNELYVRWWLSWGTIVLGLISTASVIPEFLASGSIDLVLAKPISRVKLIALKFAGSLLFVAVQVAIGVTLAWLLIGAKVGVWLSLAFLAIPLITLQFFYLYSISTLVALLTRSTVASLLLTVLCWGCFSAVQLSANKMEELYVGQSATRERLGSIAAGIRHRAEIEQRELRPAEVAKATMMESQAADLTSIVEMLEPWQGKTRAVEVLVPKTADIQKMLANATKAPVFTEMDTMAGPLKEQMRRMYNLDRDELEVMWEANNAGKRAARDVHPLPSILTSLIVPLLCLGAAVVVFVRRDY